MYKVMAFLSFAKKFGSKYGKKFLNKGISAAKRFNKSKYGQALKKERLKLAKSSGKQILDKVDQSDQSDGTYNQNKDIRFKTPQLRSDLCDFNDAYIVVTAKISATNPDDDNYHRKLACKNSALFFSSELRINSQKVDFCDDLDVIVPMYNLLYSKNYIKATDFFGIITEMNQILNMLVKMKEQEYFIQLKIQKALTIKQNY